MENCDNPSEIKKSQKYVYFFEFMAIDFISNAGNIAEICQLKNKCMFCGAVLFFKALTCTAA